MNLYNMHNLHNLNLLFQSVHQFWRWIRLRYCMNSQVEIVVQVVRNGDNALQIKRLGREQPCERESPEVVRDWQVARDGQVDRRAERPAVEEAAAPASTTADGIADERTAGSRRYTES